RCCVHRNAPKSCPSETPAPSSPATACTAPGSPPRASAAGIRATARKFRRSQPAGATESHFGGKTCGLHRLSDDYANALEAFEVRPNHADFIQHSIVDVRRLLFSYSS